MKKLQMAGIRLDDTQYVDLYFDYMDMHRKGEKMTYIVSFLSTKYKVSERKVYGIIKRFKKDCTEPAV